MGRKLKYVREEKGMSQTELAYKAGVSQRHIAFIEQGVRNPSIDVAGRIARALGVSMDDIFLPSECTNSTQEKE